MVSPGPAAKLLRATICFSIAHACPRDVYVKTSNDITCSCFAGNIRDFKIQRLEGNENVRKNNRCGHTSNFTDGQMVLAHGEAIFFVCDGFHQGEIASGKFPWIRENEQKNYPWQIIKTQSGSTNHENSARFSALLWMFFGFLREIYWNTRKFSLNQCLRILFLWSP